MIAKPRGLVGIADVVSLVRYDVFLLLLGLRIRPEAQQGGVVGAAG